MLLQVYLKKIQELTDASDAVHKRVENTEERCLTSGRAGVRVTPSSSPGTPPGAEASTAAEHIKRAPVISDHTETLHAPSLLQVKVAEIAEFFSYLDPMWLDAVSSTPQGAVMIHGIDSAMQFWTRSIETLRSTVPGIRHVPDAAAAAPDGSAVPSGAYTQTAISHAFPHGKRRVYSSPQPEAASPDPQK